MNLWQSIGGMVILELTCADVSGTLSLLLKNAVQLQELQFPSPLTVRILLRRQDIKLVRKICMHRGDKVRICRLEGIYWSVKGLLRRPVLVFGILFLLFAALWLPTRVLFIRISGNSGVSETTILDEAARCGVSFGASVREVRSERIKNQLLERIPQLQWVGVNTAGCVATIQVKENIQESQSPEISGTFDICAFTDAVVTQIITTKGTASCRIGQAVTTGQVLISAHQQTGDILIYTGAAGEVYGDTKRQNICITPIIAQKRGKVLRQTTRISLIIGKNQINLQNDSGIYSGSCVKIRKEKPLTLPGGFILPLSIVTERITYYETQDVMMEENAFDWVKDCSKSSILQQMVAGKILSSSFVNTITDGLYILQGSFTCNEMIGTITNEELSHGENS